MFDCALIQFQSITVNVRRSICGRLKLHLLPSNSNLILDREIACS